MNKEVALDNSNIDLINRLQNEYKMAFENIPEKSCLNICWNWNIEMYISSLKRILYLDYNNATAEYCFDQTLAILEEMKIVAKCCISFLQIHHILRQNVLNNEMDYELVDEYLQRYNNFLDILDSVTYIDCRTHELSFLKSIWGIEFLF